MTHFPFCLWTGFFPFISNYTAFIYHFNKTDVFSIIAKLCFAFLSIKINDWCKDSSCRRSIHLGWYLQTPCFCKTWKLARREETYSIFRIRTFKRSELRLSFQWQASIKSVRISHLFIYQLLSVCMHSFRRQDSDGGMQIFHVRTGRDWPNTYSTNIFNYCLLR